MVKSKESYKFFKKRFNLFSHILIWAIFVIFSVHLLSTFFVLKEAIVRTLVYYLIIIPIFYFHFNILIPRFLEKKKYLKYFGSIIILLIVMSVFNNHFLEYFNPSLEDIEKLKKLPQHPPRTRMLVGGAVFMLFTSLFIKLFNNFWKNEDLKKQLITQKTDAELKLLKSQVNPHFLFNTLNNIYTLSYQGSPKAPEMILSLSEIMRYMIHETVPDKVLVSKEIDYIKSYIELEKLRIEDTKNIIVDIDIRNTDIMVAPLLFIPFVENAFKHSRISDYPDCQIFIKLMVNHGKLFFMCENSIPPKPFNKDKTGGIGLSNVKKRLEIIYPGQYNLSIESSDIKYIVNLELNIQK